MKSTILGSLLVLFLAGLLLLTGCGEGYNGALNVSLAQAPGGLATVTGASNAVSSDAGKLSVAYLTRNDANTLAQLPPGRTYLAGVQCSPDKTQFLQTVILTVTLTQAMTPGDQIPVFTLGNAAWNDSGQYATVSSDGYHATMQINHFSAYAFFDSAFTVQTNQGFDFSLWQQVTGSQCDFSYAGSITWKNALGKIVTDNYTTLMLTTMSGFNYGNMPIQAGNVLVAQKVTTAQSIVYYKIKVISADAVKLVFEAQQLTGVAGPRLSISTIFASTNIAIPLSQRLCWTPDGSQIAFTGSPGFLYTVSAASSSTPAIAILPTDPAAANGLTAPNFTVKGTTTKLAFATGWLGTDHNLHFMSIPLNLPSSGASELRYFNGDQISLTHDANVLPDQLSMSSVNNGERAVGIWPPILDNQGKIVGYGGAYTIDWGGGVLTLNLLGSSQEVTSAAISSDGVNLAYGRSDGNLYWRPFIHEQETTVGTGSWPSWSANGKYLGYADKRNGFVNNYTVLNVTTNTKITYPIPPNISCQDPILSPDGSSIAFLTSTTQGQGIAIGTFQQ